MNREAQAFKMFHSLLFNAEALPKAGIIGGQKALCLSEIHPGERLRKRRRQARHMGKAGPGEDRLEMEEREALRRRLETIIKKLEEVRREMEAQTLACRKELMASLEEIEVVGRKIDAMATIGTLWASLGRIVGKGMKSLAGKGGELASLNRELARDVLGSSGGRIRNISIQAALSNTREGTSSMPLLVALGREAVDYFFRMQSPSYWAAAVSAFMNGVSMRESLFESSPEEVINQSLEKLEKSHRQVMRHINRRIGNIRARLRAMGFN